MDPYPFGECECGIRDCECSALPGPAALVVVRATDKKVLSLCTRCIKHLDDKIISIIVREATREQVKMYFRYDALGSMMLTALLDMNVSQDSATIH